MKKERIDIMKHKDGTVTCYRYGNRVSFTAVHADGSEYTDEEIVQRAYYEFMLLEPQRAK